MFLCVSSDVNVHIKFIELNIFCFLYFFIDNLKIKKGKQNIAQQFFNYIHLLNSYYQKLYCVQTTHFMLKIHNDNCIGSSVSDESELTVQSVCHQRQILFDLLK